MSKKPLVLCVLDGFGYSERQEFNAVFSAKTPAIDNLWEKYPHTLLHAAGMEVGLPEGQMGNSEVGHTAIGLGRVIFQDLPRISMSVKNNTLKDAPGLMAVIKHLTKNGKRCHIWGLLSDGGIHSHIEHLFALIDIMLENGIEVFVHACTDGRDTPPKSATQYIEMFEDRFKGKVKLATIGGRYFGMDRDKRWERTEQAYNCMIQPVNFEDSADKYISHCYANGIFDEFIPPIALKGYDGIKDGDAFIAFNFRADRVRQMLTALADESFSGFTRSYGLPKISYIIGMTEYFSEFNGKIDVIFKREEVKNSLGEILAKAGLRQFRVAETEKYPHVTFFFNGGIEEALENEERCLIDSPKVETYDLEPEMSAKKITNAIIDKLKKDDADVYIVNFANPDMVGHTGNFDATVKSIETMDSCLQEINDIVQSKNGCFIVTADHGNAEEMFSPEKNQLHTAHTTNDVIFILACNDYKSAELSACGGLKDIAPTILDILNIEKPSDMTGKSLIETANKPFINHKNTEY